MFDVFKKILNKKEITEDEAKKVSDWPMIHWLAGNPVGVQFAQIFNQYSGIPMKQKIDFLQCAVPASIKWIKYPKKDKGRDKFIELISKHFVVSREKARDYYDILSEEDLFELENYYDEGGVKRK